VRERHDRCHIDRTERFFVTDNVLGTAEFDIVHVNVDFPRVNNSVGSSHKPLVARFEPDG
jgi:hypothetical protein